MIPEAATHVAHHARHVAMIGVLVHHRLFVTGTKGGRSLLGLSAIAARLRRDGHDVTTAGDLCPERDFEGFGYARAAAEAMLETDAVVLAPGWETDANALATCEIAEVLGVPVIEWYETDEDAGTPVAEPLPVAV